MIYIGICDDEPYMLEMLSESIQRYASACNFALKIRTFESGEQVLRCKEDFDILFLDIKMDSIDGMEVARTLRRQSYKGAIIFVTALKEHVFDSFEVGACDFLIKPISEEKLADSFKRALASIKIREEVLVVQKGAGSRVVPIEDIRYCEVINRKVYLHMWDKEIIDYYDKIENLEEKLGKIFFRCHRSYLVNLRYVRGYEKGVAVLLNGVTVPVSRLRGQEFSQVILEFMKDR